MSQHAYCDANHNIATKKHFNYPDIYFNWVCVDSTSRKSEARATAPLATSAPTMPCSGHSFWPHQCGCVQLPPPVEGVFGASYGA